ncbi:MAG: alginate lyase family protein [Gemmatimonas sp.]
MSSRLLSKIQQLKGRSPHELYARVIQRAYIWSERAALAVGKSKAPLPVLTTRTFRQEFFPGFHDLGATLEALRRHTPHDESEVLDRAAAIERGNIPLLGYGMVHVGPLPEWQRDPFVNLSAPLHHWSTIPYLDPKVVGDHKVVWEISRHQYFVTIGQAWLYSRDERWPQSFVQYIQSWLDGNPASVGMNWASSLEVSYRAISWIWAMQLMHDASAIDAQLRVRILQSLKARGRHLERYLSTYFSPNTHLTGEALGLFYIGTQCPELPEAARWRAMGSQILEESINKQVLPDGVYFEQATQYHRYTIDIYLHYWLLSQSTQPAASSEVWNALNRMFDVLLHLTRADGSIPLIGDDDGGRLVQLDNRRPTDVRSLLATGATILGRHDLAWMGRADDAALCWMLGGNSVAARDLLVDEPPTETSRAFADGGTFVMRDGWGATDGHVTIDAGPHGALSFGHSHADPLSVELAVGGRPLFVDTGTFTYMGAERDAFRSTAAHNTVEVDATSTSRPGTAFRWESVSHPTALTWTEDAKFTYFTGQHSAYASLPSPLVHQRGVLHAAQGIWIVRDQLVSNGQHEAALRWHCAAGISVEQLMAGTGSSAVSLSEDNTQRAVLVAFGGRTGSMRVERGWVSEQLGHKSPSNVCVWRESTIGNAVLASIVVDSARYDIAWEATARFREQMQGAQGVLAVRAKDEGASEYTLIVVGNENSVTFLDLAFVADITCIQVDAVTGKAVDLIAVGVSAVNIPSNNGITFVFSGAGAHWVSVSNINAGDSARQVRSGLMAPPGVHATQRQQQSLSTLSTV